MSNLISLLNPKTNSFNGYAPAATTGLLTAADVCAALSYSGMSALSNELIRFKHCNEGTDSRLVALARVMVQTKPDAAKQYRITDDQLTLCALIALVEFCRVPADYKPSGRSRAVYAGVSKTFWSDRKLSKLVDSFGEDIKQAYCEGVYWFEAQFKNKRYSDFDDE